MLSKLYSSAYEDTKDHNSDKESEAVEVSIEGRPQYLTANCVVYSFYSGDLTSAIEDHFNRALKRSPKHHEAGSNNESVLPDNSPSHSDSTKQTSGKLTSLKDHLTFRLLLRGYQFIFLRFSLIFWIQIFPKLPEKNASSYPLFFKKPPHKCPKGAIKQ